MSHPSLRQLQTWFQAVMSSPAPLDGAIAAAREIHGLDDQILTIPPAEDSAPPGLQICARGYWLRLMECLRAEYPALAALMGEQLFDFFARSYLHCYPSTSSTLYDLVALPDFLESTQSVLGTMAHEIMRFDCPHLRDLRPEIGAGTITFSERGFLLIKACGCRGSRIH